MVKATFVGRNLQEKKILTLKARGVALHIIEWAGGPWQVE
jgi:hypothetical protein